MALPLPTVLCVVVLTISGLLLLIYGLRGRRVGEIPFCRMCEYNLTGLNAQRCPECGSALGEGAVVFGVRKRRSDFIRTGVALLSLSMIGVIAIRAGVTQWIDRVAWYSKVPAAWVLWQARATTGRTAQGAYYELDRRIRAGRLTEHQMKELARRTLAEYPAVIRSGHLGHVAFTVLNELRSAGVFTPEQEAQFFEKIVSVEMNVRAEAAVADGIPVTVTVNVFDRWEANPWLEVRLVPRLPTGDRRTATQPLGWRIERAERGYSWPGGYRRFANRTANHAWGPVSLFREEFVAWRLRAPIREAGPQQVACEIVIDFYEGRRDLADPKKSKRVHTRTVRLEGTCDALATDAATLIIRDAPSTTAPAGWPRGWRRRLVEMSWGTDDTCPNGGIYRGELYLTRALLPHGGAFDVTIEAGGQRYDAGRILHSPGENCAWRLETGCAPPGVAFVDIVLTPNHAAARRTAELTEIWDTTIRLDRIPVSQVLLPSYPLAPRRQPVYLTPPATGPSRDDR